MKLSIDDKYVKVQEKDLTTDEALALGISTLGARIKRSDDMPVEKVALHMIASAQEIGIIDTFMRMAQEFYDAIEERDTK